MAISFVSGQERTGSSGSGKSDKFTVSLPSPATLGNTIFIVVRCPISPSKPTGFNLDLSVGSLLGQHQLHRRTSTGGEVSWQVTLFAPATFAWYACEVAGLRDSGPHTSDTEDSGISLKSSQAAGSLTTSVSECLLFATIGGTASSASATAPSFSDWTNDFIERGDVRSSNSSFANMALGVAAKVVSASGAYTTTGTLTPAGYATGILAAYSSPAIPVTGIASPRSSAGSVSSAGVATATGTAALTSGRGSITAFGDSTGVAAMRSGPGRMEATGTSAGNDANPDQKLRSMANAILPMLRVFGPTANGTTVRPSDRRHLGGRYAGLLSLLSGVRTAPPLLVPQDATVGSSRVTWTSSTPGGGSVLIETSVDGGLTWQTATDGQSVPRVTPDTTGLTSVLARATLTRPSIAAASPKLSRLTVAVSAQTRTDELVLLMTGTLSQPRIQDDAGGVTISLSGHDFSRQISRAKWEVDWVIPEGTNVGVAIRDAISNRRPSTQFNFASTTAATPRVVFRAGGDPWDDLSRLATDIGMELLFDHAGVLVLRQVPDPDTASVVWEFRDTRSEDVNWCRMVSLSRSVPDDQTYNRVVVTGEANRTDADGKELPVPVAVASDADPDSPTYVGGEYGLVTLHHMSSTITTENQAVAVAVGLLNLSKGATDAVDITHAPVPFLEPSDAVKISRSRSKVDGKFVLDATDIPLGVEAAQRDTTRRRRL